MRKGPALVRIKFFLLCENVFWTPMLYHACMHNIVQLTFRGVWGGIKNSDAKFERPETGRLPEVVPRG